MAAAGHTLPVPWFYPPSSANYLSLTRTWAQSCDSTGRMSSKQVAEHLARTSRSDFSCTTVMAQIRNPTDITRIAHVHASLLDYFLRQQFFDWTCYKPCYIAHWCYIHISSIVFKWTKWNETNGIPCHHHADCHLLARNCFGTAPLGINYVCCGCIWTNLINDHSRICVEKIRLLAALTVQLNRKRSLRYLCAMPECIYRFSDGFDHARASVLPIQPALRASIVFVRSSAQIPSWDKISACIHTNTPRIDSPAFITL